MSRVRSVAAAAMFGLSLAGISAIPFGTAAEPAPPPKQQPAQRQNSQPPTTYTLPPAQTKSEVAGPGTLNDVDGPTSSGPRSTLKPEQVLEWRKKYPFRSLADRLKYEAERAPNTPPPLTPEAERTLATSQSKTRDIRSESFRLLHEEKVEEFVARSGFGVSRMMFDVRSPVFYEFVDTQPIPFAKVPDGSEPGPALRLPSTRDAASAAGGAARWMPTSADMQSLHASGTNSFASPWSFGYVKSVDEVAGFKSHAFMGSPQLPVDLAQPQPNPELDARRAIAAGKPVPPAKSWQLTRLELTSLLKHDKPRVYVSEHLPRMEDLSSTKTRELSKFETASLAKLHEGEELIVESTTNRIEMLGALRAGKDCRQCHEVPLGTLLGAFSYELRRDPPIGATSSSTGAVQ